MNRILTSFLLIALLGVTISCNTTKTDVWMRYQVEKDEVVYLKINEKDTSYTAHWFMSGKENELCLYGKITFSGNYLDLNNDGTFILDCNILSNVIKMSDGRVIKAPIDQNPQLKFYTKDNTLSFFDEVLSVDYITNQDDVNDLLEKFDKWEGDYVSLRNK